MNWSLPADFETVSTPLADLPLCAARLMDDARYVWVVLVPRRAGAVEIEDLLPAERDRLTAEAVEAGRRIRAMGRAVGRPVEKLNIAQLGNVTRALHMHVIGRRSDDEAWPRPIWGVGEAVKWRDAERTVVAAAWSAAY